MRNMKSIYNIFEGLFDSDLNTESMYELFDVFNGARYCGHHNNTTIYDVKNKAQLMRACKDFVDGCASPVNLKNVKSNNCYIFYIAPKHLTPYYRIILPCETSINRDRDYVTFNNCKSIVCEENRIVIETENIYYSLNHKPLSFYIISDQQLIKSLQEIFDTYNK